MAQRRPATGSEIWTPPEGNPEAIRPCCLREENLYVAEWVARDRIVRKCRHCQAKHIRMKCDSIPIRIGMDPISTVHGKKAGGRNFTMGLGRGGFGRGAKR